MLIQDIVKILTDSGIETNEASIEVRLLIEKFADYKTQDFILGKKLDESKLEIVRQKALIRAKTRQPIQYIIGEADFMGEKFLVNNSVLIPRDETEILVRKVIEAANMIGAKNILDIGTGSGIIACMCAKYTNAKVMGVDISTNALEVAISNMQKMELFNRATFRKSDLFSAIYPEEKFDIIVSNPPYIPPSQKEFIQTEVTFEPDIALYTKDDKGLEFYKKIIESGHKYLNANGYLMFELGIRQSEDVKNLFEHYGYKNIEIIKDLADIDRVICAKI